MVNRFLLASAGFERRLREVEPDQWTWPTPCTEWDVRQLVNHMTQANLSYVRLLRGGTSTEFVQFREVDALGTDPLGAYTLSVRTCADAFGQPGAPGLRLDHPLGEMSGKQALAVRTTDSTIHTWDLARAIGADETLDEDLVAWISDHIEEIYAGLPETPTSTETTHRFFAAPQGVPAPDASLQERLLRRTGRTP